MKSSYDDLLPSRNTVFSKYGFKTARNSQEVIRFRQITTLARRKGNFHPKYALGSTQTKTGRLDIIRFFWPTNLQIIKANVVWNLHETTNCTQPKPEFYQNMDSNQSESHKRLYNLDSLRLIVVSLRLYTNSLCLILQSVHWKSKEFRWPPRLRSRYMSHSPRSLEHISRTY